MFIRTIRNALAGLKLGTNDVVLDRTAGVLHYRDAAGAQQTLGAPPKRFGLAVNFSTGGGGSLSATVLANSIGLPFTTSALGVNSVGLNSGNVLQSTVTRASAGLYHIALASASVLPSGLFRGAVPVFAGGVLYFVLLRPGPAVSGVPTYQRLDVLFTDAAGVAVDPAVGLGVPLGGDPF